MPALPTRWTIESSNDRTCAVFLVVPDLGIQVRLEKGSNTIDLPAMQPGTLAYSCSMGMYGGRIHDRGAPDRFDRRDRHRRLRPAPIGVGPDVAPRGRDPVPFASHERPAKDSPH